MTSFAAFRLSDADYARTHESGHVIAALAQGFAVTGVFAGVGPDGIPAGGALISPDQGPPYEQAICALSGLAATWITGDRSAGGPQERGNDLELARGYLRDCTPAERSQVEPATLALLRSHWPQLLRLREALAERTQLDREDLAVLFPQWAAQLRPTSRQSASLAILARTVLPSSVYELTVRGDSPTVWWRLDEDIARLQDGLVLNSGTGGSTYDAAYVGSPFVGDQTLVVNDPGAGARVQSSSAATGTPLMGFTLPNATLDLLAQTTFAIEAWIRVDEGGFAVSTLAEVANGSSAQNHMFLGYRSAGGTGTDGQLWFYIVDSAFMNVYGVVTTAGTVLPGGVHHVVAVVEPGGQLAIWLDGTRYTTLGPGSATSSVSGVTRPSGGNFHAGHQGDSTPSPASNWHGTIDEMAIYFDGELPTSAVIATHYDAGSHPWQGDLPGERAERILDLAEWPAALRELDDGEETLQSADIAGQTALEHLQKLGETEAGAFFFTREGKARLIARAALFARAPGPVIFGDAPGEVGYSAITVSDGDEVIRNTAVISRLNGVAKRASDSGSVSEFGPFTYTLEGLLHDSDAHSQEYADFVAAEYAEPRRRVTSLTFRLPRPSGEDADWAHVLGLELAEAIIVRNRPLGGGDPFEQVCVVEGIDDAGAPGGVRTRTLRLSPEFSGDF